MRKFYTLLAREVRGYFHSPIAYIVLIFLIITKYQLLYTGWRGYLIAFFGLVWIANVYMSLFGFIRVGMKSEKIESKIKEVKLKECEENI